MLNVGFIGAGRVSTVHAIEYLQSKDARLAAVADLDRGLGLQRAREWGVPEERVVADYHDLLAMPDIDAVEVLLPHHLHHPIALEALAAGKHVSVEKPMTGTIEQADEMIAAAKAAGKLLRVHEQLIHYPPVLRAKDLIDAGEIGDLISIRHKTFIGRSDKAWVVPMSARQWRMEPEKAQGGQWLTDDGHHAYALAWFLMGMPDEVFAWTGRTERFGAINDIPALVTYRKGDLQMASWEATLSPELEIDTDFYAADDVIEVTGTRGVIWVTRGMGKMLHQPPVVLYRDEKFTPFEDMLAGWDDAFMLATRAFIEAMTRGERPSLAGEDAREILRWCLAAEESARTGRTVKL